MNTLIGTIAAILTTSAMFPQAFKIIKTRDVRSISLWMYIANTIGICFWLAFGLMIDEKPIIYANLIAVIPASVILFMKLWLDKKK